MGENLDVPGRLAVRTPMQWTPGPNAGFAPTGKRALVRPVPTGLYGPDQINVADQRTDPDSLWSFIRRLISLYRQSPEIGWSGVEVIDQADQRVLVHVCRKDDWSLVAMHNLAAEPVEIDVKVPGIARGTTLVDLLSSPDSGQLTAGPAGRLRMTMAPYGYAWWRVVLEDDRRIHS